MNIHDIARIAGVSASTVSKVMNGKDKDISEETKKKVLKVIEEKQYVPYFKFREKEGLKNHLIGLVVKKGNRERDVLVMEAEREARRKGYGLLVHYVEDDDELQECLDKMMNKKVSGLFLDSSQWVSGDAWENTTVYLGQTKEFDERQKTTFYYRLSEAGKMAAESLMAEGHQKIACIIQEKEHAVMQGYMQAMKNENISVQPMWAYEGSSLEDIEKYGVHQTLSENVTAVICGSPEIACCVWKLMERTKTVIPDALSMIVVGDGNILDILGDGITAVKLPVEDLIRDAVGCLIQMIQDEKHIELMRKFSPSLVKRKSIVRPAQERQGEKIVVVGSMNMDITIEMPRIPANGETQLAERLFMFPGGKGGNQAVGVGKLGGQVYMIGCLGNDVDGKQLYAGLAENHVHMDGVTFDTQFPSGKAYISVDRNGESSIVVYQGANMNLDISQMKRYSYLFENAKYCLLSLEIPASIVEYVIHVCGRNQTEVILKPSAVEKIKEELFSEIAYFVPNEKELHMLVAGEQSVEEKAEILRRKGIKNVIVTLGARGCYLRNEEMSVHFKGTGFEPIDTTGGADSFISALAVYLSEGRTLVQAIQYAVYASGITVTRYGVQPALPDRKAVEIYEDEIYSKYKLVEEESGEKT